MCKNYKRIYDVWAVLIVFKFFELEENNDVKLTYDDSCTNCASKADSY